MKAVDSLSRAVTNCFKRLNLGCSGGINTFEWSNNSVQMMLFSELCDLMWPVPHFVACLGLSDVPKPKTVEKLVKTSLEIRQEWHYFDISNDY